jgi:hypothetical protein
MNPEHYEAPAPEDFDAAPVDWSPGKWYQVVEHEGESHLHVLRECAGAPQWICYGECVEPLELLGRETFAVKWFREDESENYILHDLIDHYERGGAMDNELTVDAVDMRIKCHDGHYKSTKQIVFYGSNRSAFRSLIRAAKAACL